MTDNVSREKSSVREKMLRVRNNLAPHHIQSMSQDIFNAFIKLDKVQRSSTIMAYLSFGSEVNADYIIEWAWNKNKRVVVPVCIPKTKRMIPSIIHSFRQVEQGYFGIRQPKKEFLRPVDKQAVDLIVVPAVAFDRLGYRIGYGGGYYDRILAHMKKEAVKIGLAFHCQLVSRLPVDKHDIPVDLIVTEKGVIDARAGVG